MLSEKAQLYKIDFERTFNWLHFCVKEVKKAKILLFVNELINVWNALVKLHNLVEKKVHQPPNLLPIVSFKKQQGVIPLKEQPDYQYLWNQLDAAANSFEESTAHVTIAGFNKVRTKIIRKLEELKKACRAALRINEEVAKQEFIITADYFQAATALYPMLVPLIDYLKQAEEPAFKKSVQEKSLLPPRNGGYKKSVQTFTTYPTGSKAPLIYQGLGKNADREKFLKKEAKPKRSKKRK